MASARWQISGEYLEACSCDSVCPCPTSGLAAPPTRGFCDAGLVFRVERGQYADTRLDGLSFAVLLHTPGPMIQGNWTVGVIVDERASTAQREALTAIASGQSGGPMAALGPLVTEMAGIERRPVSFETDGMHYAVKAGELVDQSLDGVPSASKAGEPIYIDNTCHPVSAKLALANAKQSSFHAFGIDWDDASGTRNGHFASFAWTG
jgi:hypothetical protein